MVRVYILTDREREILEHFLKNGEKLNGFAVLIHYLKKSREQIDFDLELIDTVMEKLKE